MVKVRETLKFNEEFKQILTDKFCNYSFSNQNPYINYGQSRADFIISEDIDDEIEDDVFGVKDKSQLTKFGVTQLDIDLYAAACILQVREIERLLKLGADGHRGAYYLPMRLNEYSSVPPSSRRRT